jgi:hypothetical protein
MRNLWRERLAKGKEIKRNGRGKEKEIDRVREESKKNE